MVIRVGIGSSCSTCVTRRVTLVTNPMISHNEERTELCLRKTEHIRGYLRYRYSVTVNHVMMANVKLSKK
jgi:hypothetical protein